MTDLITPSAMRSLVGSVHMPHPIKGAFNALGFEVLPAKHLPPSRPAVTWAAQGIVRFRPGGEEPKRVALAHELGHICLNHAADRPWHCEYRSWASQHPEERDADRWLLDYLLPEEDLIPWIDLGAGLRLTILAQKARVPLAVARRQLKRLDIYGEVWDDALRPTIVPG
jgi:hypothetical protein